MIYGEIMAKRPPTTAHLRYQEQRDAFQGLSMQERFQHIHDTNMWGAETSVSGLGSEDDATATLRRELPNLLNRIGAQSLLDAPCGDASWIMRSDLGVSYTGMDIVTDLIEKAKQRVSQGTYRGTFLQGDFTNDPLPNADAILCRDCLVHLSNESIAAAITNFRNSGSHWLITTTFSDWEDNENIEDGDWHALNFTREPFLWPEPFLLLNEGCTEVGGAYPDKCLGVWRIAEIPKPPIQP